MQHQVETIAFFDDLECRLEAELNAVWRGREPENGRLMLIET